MINAITLLFATVPKKRSIKVNQNTKVIEQADFQTALPKNASPSAIFLVVEERLSQERGLKSGCNAPVPGYGLPKHRASSL